jgi:hypothetical protein
VVARAERGVDLLFRRDELEHRGLARLRRSDADLGLPPGVASRRQVLRDFLQLWRPGDRNAILRATDPMPFVRETLDWFRPRKTARGGSRA